MKLPQEYHLTYCTNIYPAETWQEVFDNLRDSAPLIKQRLAPHHPFGIGLYLSNTASLEILQENRLSAFKTWLDKNDLYVFTMNGFPYGGFHGKVVKDKVYQPDWSNPERTKFTKRLFQILSTLLPDGMEGGISTSPVSYKYWLTNEQSRDDVFSKATIQLIEVTSQLHEIENTTGKLLHLDLEPEPDCFLENSDEVVFFFNHYLFEQGATFLSKKTGSGLKQAREIIRKHLRICYDVCHFAVEFEDPKEAIKKFEANGISIGKIQISSALKADLFSDNREIILKELSEFVEPTYFHQAVANINHKKIQYRDLDHAILNINDDAKELRTHFHVPIFLENYGKLKSTQTDISEVIELAKQKKLTTHLEVETYTWEVLPDKLKTSLTDSVCRELEWVIDQFRNN